jgi:hypothetical protein
MALIDEHSARRTAQGLGSRRVGLSVLTVTLKCAASISQGWSRAPLCMDYRALNFRNLSPGNIQYKCIFTKAAVLAKFIK